MVDLAGWEQGWEKFLKGMSWENWYSLSLWPFLIYPFVPYLSYLTFMTLTGASHLHVGSCVDIALSVVARSCVTDGFDSLSHIPWESPSRKGMSSTCFPRAVCPCALHAVSLTLFHSWCCSLIRYCLFRWVRGLRARFTKLPRFWWSAFISRFKARFSKLEEVRDPTD